LIHGCYPHHSHSAALFLKLNQQGARGCVAVGFEKLANRVDVAMDEEESSGFGPLRGWRLAMK